MTTAARRREFAAARRKTMGRTLKIVFKAAGQFCHGTGGRANATGVSVAAAFQAADSSSDAVSTGPPPFYYVKRMLVVTEARGRPVPDRISDDPWDDSHEAALLAGAREDADALRALYRHYMPRVYAYVAYRAGSTQDTEDIVSETFLRVAANLRRFKYRGEGSFAAWLFRIANNQVNDHQRRRGRRGPDLPLEAAAEVADGDPAPGDALQRRQEFEEMRRLVVTLPPQRQKVVLLRFFGGLRNREIAKVMRLDERTVASHLRWERPGPATPRRILREC